MDDFYKTSIRMMNDAKILNASGSSISWSNICYLSGYVLECYGKLLISINTRGSFGHDLVRINNKIQTDITLLPTLTKYCVDFNTMCSSIFNDPYNWDPKKRYEPDLWNSKDIVDKYLREAEYISSIINQMKIDGVI